MGFFLHILSFIYLYIPLYCYECFPYDLITNYDKEAYTYNSQKYTKLRSKKSEIFSINISYKNKSDFSNL